MTKEYTLGWQREEPFSWAVEELLQEERQQTRIQVEGINSKIETMCKAACGFRNKMRFRTAILFRFGGLDLFPATHR